MLPFSAWIVPARACPRDGNAEKRIMSDLYAEGDKNGIAMVNFEAKNRLR